MIGKTLYSTLIAITILAKSLWFVVDFMYYYKKYTGTDETTAKQLKQLDAYLMTTAEVFMYLVIIVTFSPHRKSTEIRLSREEQIIAFAIGVLGLIHTNWRSLREFGLKLSDAREDHKMIGNLKLNE